jgi:hypothetical protein
MYVYVYIYIYIYIYILAALYKATSSPVSPKRNKEKTKDLYLDATVLDDSHQEGGLHSKRQLQYTAEDVEGYRCNEIYIYVYIYIYV